MDTSNGMNDFNQEQEIQNQNQVPMPTKPQPEHGYLIRGVSLLLIVIISYYLGYQSGHSGYAFSPKEFKVVNQGNMPATVDYNLLWDAIETLNEKYIDKPLDQQKILYGAVKGAVDAVGDPYTVFMEPKQLENFQAQLKGSFSGIGAEVGKKQNNIVIVAPLDGTPAKRAGLLAGDIIVNVDGLSTAGWSVEQAVEKIRGTKGTAVTLNIYREGKDKPFDVKIVRDTILIKSVKWSFKEVETNGQKKIVGIITLSEFGDDTKTLFTQAINEILSKKVDGVVVDVRNNPGGYLQTAVDVASAWIKSGEIVVSEQHSDGSKKEYKASGSPRLANIKTVVLINGGSASASEILSGALRDHGFAKLIGEKSFGKGSVQELVELDKPQDSNQGPPAVKVTVAKWITPSGKNINQEGIQPDIEIKLTEEDINGGKDPQMDRAVEEILK